MLLLSVALLSGCAWLPVRTETRAVRHEIPAALLSCMSEPEIPANVETQRQLMALFADMTIAGRDCRAKLHEIQMFQRGQDEK